MTTYHGFTTGVMYDEETSYGAGSTPATTIKGRLQTITINKNNNFLRTCGLGEGRNETFVGWGNFECTWSMEYHPGDFNFLQFLIGSLSGSGTTIAPYYLEEETYMDYTVGADSGLKSFGMNVGSESGSGTDDEDQLTGCVINTASFMLNVGEVMKVSLEGFAKTCSSDTTATDFTSDTTKPWIFAQGNFKWNGSAVARILSATINVNNNYDPETGRELGSRFVEAAEPGLRKYDWTITVKMTDTIATTLRDHFYGQVDSPNTGIDPSEPTLYDIVLDLKEGALSGDRQAAIYLSDCSINDISKPINIGDNVVELTINGAGKKATTDTVNKFMKWYTVT